MIGLLIICFSNALETIRLKTYNAGATIVWSCEIRQPPRTINGYIKIPSAIKRTESSIAKKARASFRPWRILLSSNFGVASSSPFSDMGSLLSSVVVWDSDLLSLMVKVTILPLRWKGAELELRNFIGLNSHYTYLGGKRNDIRCQYGSDGMTQRVIIMTTQWYTPSTLTSQSDGCQLLV